MDRPLHALSALEIGVLIRRGDLSSVEVTRYFLDRIERLDRGYKAFLSVMADRALDRARDADRALADGADPGPLHGVPYAAKDVFDVAGYPTTAGCDLLAGDRKATSAAAIRALDRAGMILLGKTRLVQFAHGSIGVNLNHGTPLNPWSIIPRAPGGSSSGSAVAVAAGMVPLALGTDTAGSVRGPASLCGVLGLLTTHGGIDLEGVYPLSTTLDSLGLLTTTAADALALLPLLRDPPLDGPARTPGPFRLAWAESLFAGAEPEVVAAVRRAGDALVAQGAQVGSIAFAPADEAIDINPNGLISVVEGYHRNAALLATGSAWLDPMVRRSFAAGPTQFAAAYYGALKAMPPLRARALAAMADYDALIAPTTPMVAAPIGTACASGQSWDSINAAYGSLTRAVNVLGLCAVSVPCGLSSDGLPVGLQIIGRPHCEDVVLSIAALAIEACWQGHIPRPPEWEPGAVMQL